MQFTHFPGGEGKKKRTYSLFREESSLSEGEGDSNPWGGKRKGGNKFRKRFNLFNPTKEKKRAKIYGGGEWGKGVDKEDGKKERIASSSGGEKGGKRVEKKDASFTIHLLLLEEEKEGREKTERIEKKAVSVISERRKKEGDRRVLASEKRKKKRDWGEGFLSLQKGGKEGASSSKEGKKKERRGRTRRGVATLFST